MTVDPKAKIVRILDFLPPRTSPSVSPNDPLEPPVDNPPVRRPRLLMGRFLVGTLFRHRGFWHARVRDLRTGRMSKMSSGETRKGHAEDGLVLRLQLKSAVEQIATLPPAPRESAIARASSLFSPRSSEPRPFEFEWIQDEAYQRVVRALDEVGRLVERGKVAMTPDEVNCLVQRVIKDAGLGGAGGERTGPSFSKAYEEFLKSKDVKPKTLSGYTNIGRFIGKLLQNKRVHEITGADLQDLFNRLRDGKVTDKRKRAQRTRQKQLIVLRDFFRWCRDVPKYISEDPTVGLKIKVKKSQRKKIRLGLTLDAARNLLAALRVKGRQANQDIQHVWMGAFIALRTGLRLSNVLGLQWHQVDFEAGTIRIPAKEYKADREDDLLLPMHDELRRVLRIWKTLRRQSKLVTAEQYVLGRQLDEIVHPFRSAVKRSGVETDFHNLRHAFETWLVEADVPGPVQKALMGHSSGSVTEGYAHPSMTKTRECVNRLPQLLEGGHALRPLRRKGGQSIPPGGER